MILKFKISAYQKFETYQKFLISMQLLPNILYILLSTILVAKFGVPGLEILLYSFLGAV